MSDEKKKNPNVSVIIPMYKCASFVSNLLDMVCGQTLKDIEIICVLDGPDKDIRSIIEDRAKDDARITLLEQEHGGAGTARNLGMDIAQGDYLLFLDADDLFEPNMIERMYSEAVKYDAETVMCSYINENILYKTSTPNCGFDYSNYHDNKAINCEDVKNLYGTFIGVTWNKLFLRQFINELGVRFMNTRISNDEFFVTMAMTCTTRLVVIKEDLIVSRRFINDDSISSSRSKTNEDIIIVMDEIYKWLKRSGYWEKRKNDYFTKVEEFLRYNCEYDYNDNFIEGMAKILSTEKPWKNLSNIKLAQVLKLSNRDLAELAIVRNNISDEIRALNRDDSASIARLKRIENILNAKKAIRLLMKERYGRDLGKKTNPISWLVWSVGYRGWTATIRRIKGKLQSDELLEPKKTVCAGHLTTAGHYLTFFIPIDTHREKAFIDELSMVVRCNGYYPIAVAGNKREVLTTLGPRRTAVINGGKSTRRGEVMRAYAEVSSGIGIFVEIRFKEALLKNHKGDPAGNNQPVSVQIFGKIRLK